MKVAMYYSQNDIRIESAPCPKISEHEVLVEMEACGVCGSDLMSWYLEGRAPLVLGHEPAGTIAEKGSLVKNFEVGDRVFVHHHVACLKCHYCMRGDYTLCKQFHETNIDPGGFAEYFRVPATNLQLDTLKIPDNVTFDEATLIEPAACCLRALRKCNLQRGDTVVVVGAGATGIIHVALSKILGATKVFVSDLFDYRLAVAEKFGADCLVNFQRERLEDVVETETNKQGADLVVVTAPSLEAYQTSLKVCRKGGKLCVFAPTKPGVHMQVSPKQLFFSEVQIIPSYSTSHLETRVVAELMALRKLDLRRLITHRFPLDYTAKAFKTALESKDSLKVLVVNG